MLEDRAVDGFAVFDGFDGYAAAFFFFLDDELIELEGAADDLCVGGGLYLVFECNHTVEGFLRHFELYSSRRFLNRF